VRLGSGQFGFNYSAEAIFRLCDLSGVDSLHVVHCGTVEENSSYVMPKKLYIVYLNGAPDPMDPIYQQPVRASKVEVSEGRLIFAHVDGTISAFFDLSAVRNWRETNESELLRG
jgi:hypothetical protein